MIEDQESIEGFLVFDLPRTRRLEPTSGHVLAENPKRQCQKRCLLETANTCTQELRTRPCGAGGNRNTEICPGCPSGPLAPVDSGVHVCRVRLCPSSGVHSVRCVVVSPPAILGLGLSRSMSIKRSNVY